MTDNLTRLHTQEARDEETRQRNMRKGSHNESDINHQRRGRNDFLRVRVIQSVGETQKLPLARAD